MRTHLRRLASTLFHCFPSYRLLVRVDKVDLDGNLKLAPARLGHLKGRLLNGCGKGEKGVGVLVGVERCVVGECGGLFGCGKGKVGKCGCVCCVCVGLCLNWMWERTYAYVCINTQLCSVATHLQEWRNDHQLASSMRRRPTSSEQGC